MAKGYFITGTDTGVGKTRSSIALMHYFQQQGDQVMGMKPIASGCRLQEGRLYNDDALQLQNHASVQADYALVNPYAFAAPMAPHLAAKQQGQEINLEVITRAYRALEDLADTVIVEGIGGWLVPLVGNLLLPDLVVKLDIPVIVTVAIRLGCINHALLTIKAVQDSGARCAGWIASCVDPDMLRVQENISSLDALLGVPLIGVMPYQKQAGFSELANQFHLPE